MKDKIIKLLNPRAIAILAVLLVTSIFLLVFVNKYLYKSKASAPSATVTFTPATSTNYPINANQTILVGINAGANKIDAFDLTFIPTGVLNIVSFGTPVSVPSGATFTQQISTASRLSYTISGANSQLTSYINIPVLVSSTVAGSGTLGINLQNIGSIVNGPVETYQYDLGTPTAGSYTFVAGSAADIITVCPAAGAGCDKSGTNGIQEAVDAATDGKTINVRAGTYGKFIVQNKQLTILGENNATTIITAGNTEDGIYIFGTANVRISKFKITGNRNGISLSGGATVVIDNNIITNNKQAGILDQVSASGSVTIKNNLLNNNDANGIYVGDLGTSNIVNNTFFANKGAGIYLSAGSSVVSDPTVVIKNNIISSTVPYAAIASGQPGTQAYAILFVDGSATPNVSKITSIYNLGHNNTTSCSNVASLCIGAGDIADQDPKFVSATDFHLATGSPAINTGDPSLYDVDGSRSDMGAYGGGGNAGGAAATATPTGTAPTSGNMVLNLKLRFQGITVSPPAAANRMTVRVMAVNAAGTTYPGNAEFTADGPGIWSGGVPVNAPAGSGYKILVKGPQHLQKKICVATPTETSGGTYHCSSGTITLTTGQNALDFSGIVLLVGDLPEQGTEGQNGVTDSYDISYIVNNFRSTDARILSIGDLNRDGIIDGQDYAMLLYSLSIKYDEL